MDFAYVGAIFGFLMIVWAFVSGCEKLGARR